MAVSLTVPPALSRAADGRTPESGLFRDGASGAPAGTPLLPSVLNGYAVRPPWKVAGVDYAVGVPSGTALKDPATLAGDCVSVDAASHTITITGSNVTLNGYDFGLGGGWGIYIAAGAADTVVENSNFRVGSNNYVPINTSTEAGSLTVRNDTFNGGGGLQDIVWAMINYVGSGTFVSQYNSFIDTPSDAIDFGHGPMTTIVKNNVFDNLGTAPGTHPDAVQYYGVKADNSVIAFNTIYQPNAMGGMQGVQLDASGGSALTNTTIANNVLLAKGPGNDMSYSIAVIQSSGNTLDGATVQDNYIDYRGAFGPIYPPSGSNLKYGGNVNLSTGALIPNPPGTSAGKLPGGRR